MLITKAKLLKTATCQCIYIFKVIVTNFLAIC